ncbi:MAG: 30S ribosomal protein S17 [Thermoguttaceae bacterium]|nr:30S ribosomal protein S17 [Thermoguttaceae bacterium]
MPRKRLIGIVTSDRMNKTRRVEVPRLAKHPRYGKYIRKQTVCYVHDENNESHVGDTVEIIESRPLSRLKRWRLVRVITRLDVAAREALQTETSDMDVLPQAGQQAQGSSPASAGPAPPGA